MRGFRGHLDNVHEVFKRFCQHNLKLKPKKCFLFQTEIKFLGKFISKEGIHVDPDKVGTIKQRTKSTTEVESFLGFVNYHQDHIPDFAEIASCLYVLTGPKSKFAWEMVHESAFVALQSALKSAPVLGFPQKEGLFHLDYDASGTAIRAELQQWQDRELKVLSYVFVDTCAT